MRGTPRCAVWRHHTRNGATHTHSGTGPTRLTSGVVPTCSSSRALCGTASGTARLVLRTLTSVAGFDARVGRWRACLAALGALAFDTARVPAATVYDDHAVHQIFPAEQVVRRERPQVREQRRAQRGAQSLGVRLGKPSARTRHGTVAHQRRRALPVQVPHRHELRLVGGGGGATSVGAVGAVGAAGAAGAADAAGAAGAAGAVGAAAAAALCCVLLAAGR